MKPIDALAVATLALGAASCDSESERHKDEVYNCNFQQSAMRAAFSRELVIAERSLNNHGENGEKIVFKSGLRINAQDATPALRQEANCALAESHRKNANFFYGQLQVNCATGGFYNDNGTPDLKEKLDTTAEKIRAQCPK